MLAESRRCTILGAGLAGLSAACTLARQGVPVRVFESDDQVGGMAVTVQRDGYRFDLGPHRFHTHNEAVLRLVQGLLGDELLVHQRLSRIRLNGRFLDYPPNLPSLLRSMQPATSLRCLFDYFGATWQRRVRQSEEPDFESWVTHRFGRHLYSIYFDPYTRKVWGALPQTLSADLARRRISAPNLADVLRRLMISGRDDPGPYVTQFWYPKEGIGRLAERLAEEIVAHEGEVWLEHVVEAVHLSSGCVVGLTLNHQGERRYVPCEWVLSTLPLPYLIQCMEPPVDERVRQAAALPYRALLFVFVMLNKPQVGPEHWLYFPEDRYVFNRVTEPRNFSPAHAPPGKTSLCVEITCDMGDAVWHTPPAALTEQVVGDLAEAGLIDAAQVEGFFTRRLLWGYPVYSLGYESHLKLLLEFVDGIENLITFGRQGGFDYGNMAEAIASGLAAAQISTRFSEKEGTVVDSMNI